jgi:hypothetical protein
MSQPLTAHTLGFLAGSASSSPTLALNNANNRLGFSFVITAAKTLNTVRIFTSTSSGSLGANDLVCEIYAVDTATGNPTGSALASSNTLSATYANGYNTFTGFSLSLSAHTVYWIVISNANGTPASNHFTVRFTNNNTAPTYANGTISGSAVWGWNKKHSTDGGSTWGTNVTSCMGIRLGFSDATYAGFPANAVATSASVSAERVHTGVETGVIFTSPAHAGLRVIGATMFPAAQGSPTGSARYRLYTGSGGSPTLAGTTAGVPAAHLGSTAPLPLYFASAIEIPAATVCRLVVSNSAADNSSNYFYASQRWSYDSDSGSLGLRAMGGTWRQAVKDGSDAWSEADDVFYSGALILDGAQPFMTPSGGGGLLRHPGMTGGFHG